MTRINIPFITRHRPRHHRRSRQPLRARGDVRTRLLPIGAGLEAGKLTSAAALHRSWCQLGCLHALQRMRGPKDGTVASSGQSSILTQNRQGTESSDRRPALDRHLGTTYGLSSQRVRTAPSEWSGRGCPRARQLLLPRLRQLSLPRLRRSWLPQLRSFAGRLPLASPLPSLRRFVKRQRTQSGFTQTRSTAFRRGSFFDFHPARTSGLLALTELNREPVTADHHSRMCERNGGNKNRVGGLFIRWRT
jgi:hypothetical protein